MKMAAVKMGNTENMKNGGGKLWWIFILCMDKFKMTCPAAC